MMRGQTLYGRLGPLLQRPDPGAISLTVREKQELNISRAGRLRAWNEVHGPDLLET